MKELQSKRRKFGRLTRAICGVVGALGMPAVVIFTLFDLRSGLTWAHGLKFLLLAFTCYVLLVVAIKGESPDWLDI